MECVVLHTIAPALDIQVSVKINPIENPNLQEPARACTLVQMFSTMEEKFCSDCCEQKFGPCSHSAMKLFKKG